MTKHLPRGRDWLRAEGRQARRAAVPAILAGVLGVALAIVQAGCVADVLGSALVGDYAGALPLIGFVLPRWPAPR